MSIRNEASAGFDADEPLLTPGEVARVLRVHPDTLRRDRRRRRPRLPFLAYGPRVIRYRQRDLQAFIEGNDRGRWLDHGEGVR